MFIPDSDFYPSWISDPGSKNSTKERVGKNLFPYLFCSHKFHKIVNYFIFEMLQKKISASFQIIIDMSLSSQKYGFGIRDPGCGKNLFRIPDPGPGSKRHRIPDPEPQHCF
jgi:hypothetical protein